jgi:uncharacterized protein YutE (UPF0331/DUF86 family)
VTAVPAVRRNEIVAKSTVYAAEAVERAADLAIEHLIDIVSA